MSGTRQARFAQAKRPFSLPLLITIAALHLVVLYGLALALAPDFTASVQTSVVSAFTLEPAPVPPPDEPDAADQGAAGDPGLEAVPRPVTAPPPAVVIRNETPAPKVASTGAADRSGAAPAGDGTGAAGSGDGTGSGNSGDGRGAGIAIRPLHISGQINNARDYPVPATGRQARSGTEVIVRVTVGVDGRARDCSIYRASSDPEADLLTCKLVEKRLGFRPALDINGDPVAAPFFWRQRWF